MKVLSKKSFAANTSEREKTSTCEIYKAIQILLPEQKRECSCDSAAGLQGNRAGCVYSAIVKCHTITLNPSCDLKFV